MGTAWRRTSSGEFTTSTSGSPRWTIEGLPGSLEQHGVAGAQGDAAATGFRVAGACLASGPLHRENDEVAAVGDHAREDGLTDETRAWRDHHLGQAGATVEQGVLAVVRRRVLAKREMHCAWRAWRPLPPSPRTSMWSPSATGRRRGAALSPSCTATSCTPGNAERSTCDRRKADIGRGRAHAHLEDAVGEPVLLDQRLGMAAEVGRHRGAVALGQKALAEEDDDRHRAGKQRNADEGELEEAESTGAGLERRLRDEDVHRRAGEGQHRSRMGGEDERHQELRRLPLQAHRHHDHDRQQGGDRAVDADQGGQQRPRGSW